MSSMWGLAIPSQQACRANSFAVYPVFDIPSLSTSYKQWNRKATHDDCTVGSVPFRAVVLGEVYSCYTRRRDKRDEYFNKQELFYRRA